MRRGVKIHICCYDCLVRDGGIECRIAYSGVIFRFVAVIFFHHVIDNVDWNLILCFVFVIANGKYDSSNQHGCKLNEQAFDIRVLNCSYILTFGTQKHHAMYHVCECYVSKIANKVVGGVVNYGTIHAKGRRYNV